MDVMEVLVSFFIFMAKLKNIITAIKKLALSIVGPACWSWLTLRPQPHKETNIDIKELFIMHQLNLQKEVMWVWGLIQSDLDSFISLLRASDFITVKKRLL